MDISELIEDNQESIFLDFKREQYRAENKPDLIKDVLAFSNASYQPERYIIIGITKDHDGIQIFPVERPEDSAAIQQYIHENITPELNISYESYNYNGQNIMVLTIKDTRERPYFPKKTLNKGPVLFIRKSDLWLRKGSRNVLGDREDLEKIYARRYAQQGLEEKLNLTFLNGSHELEISCIGNLRWPTEENRKEIEEEIKYKEHLVKTDSKAYQAQYAGYYPGSGQTSYRSMDIRTLNYRLENVAMNFKDEDLYYLNEIRAYKLQLVITNNGEKHLENALIELSFPVVEGFTIAEHIYLSTPQWAIVTGEDYQEGYPKVKTRNQVIEISALIGEVRHQIPQEVFVKPLRIVPLEAAAGKSINVLATVHGSNLPKPQTFELIVRFK